MGSKELFAIEEAYKLVKKGVPFRIVGSKLARRGSNKSRGQLSIVSVPPVCCN